MFKFMSRSVALLALASAFWTIPTSAKVQITGSDGIAVEIDDVSRLVTLGGVITETVFTLGYGDRIVGTDLSSTYPQPETEGIAKVGYWRALSAEGILALKPSLIIADHEAGPPQVISKIRDAGVPLLIVGGEHSAEVAVETISKIAESLQCVQKGQELIARLRAELKEAERFLATVSEEPSAMFLYMRGARVFNVAGSATPVHNVLTACKASNAGAGVEGWKQINAEALVAAAPAILVITSSGLASVGGMETFLQMPGVAHTPAAKNKRVIVMDDLLLLGCGPRIGQARLELAQGLHGAH